MLNGEVITDGWKSEEVHAALDLCLACKGCKSDCPVSVDMATYKAEFLSHYYEGQPRPRHAYAMGRIFWWARLASLAPRLANFVGQTPLLRDVAKWLGGIAPQRQMPAFATETFQSWWQRRRTSNTTGEKVVLWADTFTNHFHPQIGIAAVEVLEAFGYQVEVPTAAICCGRPLYDFGLLDTARRLLLELLAAVRPALRDSTPIVVLEPSCLSVFRDELTDLLPYDRDAQRLKDLACSLSELLARREDLRLPQWNAQAIVQAHCHHHAVIGFETEQKLLEQLGLELDRPESSCCGMAGSFGFERGEHYEVSQACGEQKLLPAVRSAQDTLVIADGFSCHEQIRQGTGRTPLHFAEVLRAALRRAGRLQPRVHRRAAARDSHRLLMGATAIVMAAALWARYRGR
jgi:Fe-S oxidoreductase